MVGVGATGTESILARVSLVNYHGMLLYDSYVRPKQKITDFRTHITGISTFEGQLRTAPSLEQVLEAIDPLLKDKVIIGHALEHDFRALCMSHPRRLVRDTSSYAPFRAQVRSRGTPSLKKLAVGILHVDEDAFQAAGQAHDSVQDARIAMALYRSVKNEWENDVRKKYNLKAPQKGSQESS